MKDVFDLILNESLDDFMNYYKVVDDKEIYSNGTEFVPIFRVKQWYEYNSKDKEIERLNNLLKETSQTLSEQTTKSITLKSENERLNNIIEEALKLNRDLQEHLDKEFWIGRLELQEQILKGSDEE